MNRHDKTFFQKIEKFFSDELIWTFEDFEEKSRKMEEISIYHGLPWIGMINQNVS